MIHYILINILISFALVLYRVIKQQYWLNSVKVKIIIVIYFIFMLVIDYYADAEVIFFPFIFINYHILADEVSLIKDEVDASCITDENWIVNYRIYIDRIKKIFIFVIIVCGVYTFFTLKGENEDMENLNDSNYVENKEDSEMDWEEIGEFEERFLD